MTSFADILGAAYDIEYAAERSNRLVLARYVRAWRVAIAAAKKVARLDLYHLMCALADGGFTFQPTTDAEGLVAELFYRMDKAAAFGEPSVPLVIPADRPLDRCDFSGMEGDDPDVRAEKFARQHPSTPDWR